MLIQFTVDNFRSFNKAETLECSPTFSMIPGKVRSKESHIIKNDTMSIQKFAAVYGANAAGKSNFIRAISFAQKTILNGLPSQSTSEYCRFNDAQNKESPSGFEFKIKISNKYYRYGFQALLSKGLIHNEWLYETDIGDFRNEAKIFERHYTGIGYVLDIGENISSEVNKILNIYSRGISSQPGKLLISKMMVDECELASTYPEIQPLFSVNSWFSEHLKVVSPTASLLSSFDSLLMNQKSGSLKGSCLDIADVKNILPLFGVGIEDIRLDLISKEELSMMLDIGERRLSDDLFNKNQVDVELTIIKKQIALTRKKKELEKIELRDIDIIINNCMEEWSKYTKRKQSIENKINKEKNQKVRETLVKDLDLINNRILPSILDEIKSLQKNQSESEGLRKEIGRLEKDVTDEYKRLMGFTHSQFTPKYGYIVRTKSGVLFIAQDTTTPEPVVFKIRFDHGKSMPFFDINDESDGTQRLLDLIEILCSAKSKDGNTYIVDEIDRSLHPQMTEQFIDLFLELGIGGETQLVVTTHETYAMNLTHLRRDEIWFVEMKQNENKNLGSEFSSLEKYNERFDKRVDKAYLEGAYGALPVFEPITQSGDSELEVSDNLRDDTLDNNQQIHDNN